MSDLAVTTTAGGAVGVVQFNGGANGLSSNNALDGNWTTTNALRFRSLSGTGPLRVELTNGATLRAGTGASGTVTVAMPTTIRGVLGGNPTSLTGERNTNISRDTGRLVLDGSSIVNYTGGLLFENAVQVHAAIATRALDGNITIAGIASGNPGYVAFSGRATGITLAPKLNEPGETTAGQNVLWLGRGGNDTLKIEDGGTAVLDARMRYDQGSNHGVVLNAQALIEGGGTLRFYQSLSNASGLAFKEGQTNVNTTANVGNHIVQGNLIGTGNSAKDAAVDLYLPVGNVIPEPPKDGSLAGNLLPYGGVNFEASSNLVVNGTGFGGLRINGFARANTLFTGGTADTVSNVAKVNNLVTPTRINALTGTGGYLSLAPANETYLFPNAEWAAGTTVGLKVVDQNPNGVDLRFDAAKRSWGHNLAVDAGATLDTGATLFTLSAGTLHGAGSVIGDGGLKVASGASVAPGLGGIGTLSTRSLTLDGTFLGQATIGASNDRLQVVGNVTLGTSSTFAIDAGSTFDGSKYTFLTYTGTRTGTFGLTSNLPAGSALNYDIPGRVRLVFGTIATQTWDGTPGAIWSTAPGNANWKGGASFAAGDQVLFDDSATGSTTVTLNGVLAPDLVTINNSTKNYTINGSAGNVIGGEAALVKNGPGSLLLNGSHTYTSGTNVLGGTLALGNNDALADVGQVNVAQGGTLNLNGHSDTIGLLVVGGTVTAGSLQVAEATLNGTGAIAANLTLGGNVTKLGAGSSTITGAVNLGGANRTLSVSGETGSDLTISGIISNGSLTKTGAGLAVLGAANTYTGGTTVSEGTLRAGAANAIPNGTLQIGAGATVDLNNHDSTATTLTGSGTLELGFATLTLNPATPTTFGGVISGSGSVVKTGTGVQTLSGTNTFSDGLEIRAGRVNLASVKAAGNGMITLSTGAGLQFGAALANDIMFDGGVVSAQGTNSGGTGIWTISGATEFRLFNEDTNAGADIVFSGTSAALHGEGNIKLVASTATANADGGAGLRLRGRGISSYEGTVTAGQKTKLEIEVASAAGSNPLGNGKIVMTAGTSTGALNGTYSQLQPRTSTADQTHQFGNDVTISGDGYVNVNILGEANTVAQFGKLTLGAGQILGANKNDRAIRTMAFTDVNLTGGMAEFRAYDPGFSNNANKGGSNIRLGNISEATPGSGSGFISKSSELWSVEVAGTASYTGPTDIQAGTLRVSAAGSLASSSEVRLATDTKLDVTAHLAGYGIPATQKILGTGDWDGRLVLSGTLAPGTGIGTMTGDDFTLQGTAVMQFELSTLNNTSDKLVLSGAFDKGTAGAFQFDFEGGGMAGMTYTLVQFASTTFAASDFTLVDLAPGLSATFAMSGTSLQLAVVPEPGSAIALALGGALLGLRRRRRA